MVHIRLIAILGLLGLSCGGGVSRDPLAERSATGRPSASSSGGAAGSGGPLSSGGAGATAGTLPDERLATGTAGCTDGRECVSGACLPDVTGTPRCCASDCRATGRICSTSGTCGCSSQTRDVGGECLLIEGQPCREQGDCASNRCIDGVCCDAACDEVCERCDAPEQVGTCTFHEEDPSCGGGLECTARGRCRLPLGVTCGSDPSCDSDHCELSVTMEQICCATACNGVCQRCSANGSCAENPAIDLACPALTCPAPAACISYRTPQVGACSGNGQCAQCEPIYADAGLPCGVGRQCDGAGACQVTGIGKVAAGLRHTCAIRDNGNVLCWGKNEAGELGAAFEHDRVGDDELLSDVPNRELDFTRPVVQLTAGFAHTCALFDTGKVRCWGQVVDDSVFGTVNSLLGTTHVVRNDLGFVDPMATGDVKLDGLAVQISADPSGAHTCALLSSGQISCWGYNENAQLGTGDLLELNLASVETLPLLSLPVKALQVKAGPGHTCALLEGGGVTCWGEGNLGRLGYGDNTLRLAPDAEVPIGARAIAIETGSGHTCAVLESRRVRCWGHNNEGQLGYGHTVNIGDTETPEQAAQLPGPGNREFLGGDVPLGGGNVVQLSRVVDSRAMCARFSSGALRCWGHNHKGQLGYGHNDPGAADHTPDQLVNYPGGDGSWGGDVDIGGSALALAEGGRCALRVDGKLFCWGDNDDGELGLPQHVPGGSLTLTPREMGPVLWE